MSELFKPNLNIVDGQDFFVFKEENQATEQNDKRVIVEITCNKASQFQLYRLLFGFYDNSNNARNRNISKLLSSEYKSPLNTKAIYLSTRNNYNNNKINYIDIRTSCLKNEIITVYLDVENLTSNDFITVYSSVYPNGNFSMKVKLYTSNYGLIDIGSMDVPEGQSDAKLKLKW